VGKWSLTGSNHRILIMAKSLKGKRGQQIYHVKRGEIMRIPVGTLQSLKQSTGIDSKLLSEYCSTRKRPGRLRAKVLEKGARDIGRKIPAEVWLYGSRTELKKLMGAA
jgi:hypothetical protein